MLSPDSRWLAYGSDKTGRYEIYIRRFPPVDEVEFPLTAEGGGNPVWARDGSELNYQILRDGIVFVMTVRVTSGPPSTWHKATEAIRGSFVYRVGDTHYDVWGSRFLVIRQLAGDKPSEGIFIVQNWFEDLKRLLPAE